MKKLLTAILLTLSIYGYSQEQPVPSAPNELFDMSLEDLLNVQVIDRDFYLYGYINSNVQKTYQFPSLSNGETVHTDDPLEWTPVKNFHVYGQGNLSENISFLFNLAASGNLVEIRNAWGNYSINHGFQIRVGKMYRKFGLYNERLDQVPTFIGIEPPEMLDTDHLFLQRTTNFMVHGQFNVSNSKISYALMTDNGEAGPSAKLIPLGWDMRFKSVEKSLIFGISGYTSSVNNTKTGSTVVLGAGPPQGGILPWMAGDHFTIAGVFVEKLIGKFLIQAEYYNSMHTAERDPESVLTVINNGELNATQRERFLGDNAYKADVDLTVSDVVVNTTYNVQTGYVRLGYNIQTKKGQFVPYLFLDWMSHPEDIQKKKYGGDEEAGLADDGKFIKPSAGIVYRPIPSVAIKLDGSYHTQQYNGKNISYPEIRLDFSFAFSNTSIEKALSGN